MKKLLSGVALAALVAVAGPALAQTQSSQNAITSGSQGGRDANVSKSGQAGEMMKQNEIAPGKNRTGGVSTSRTDGSTMGANMRSKTSPDEARGQAATPSGGATAAAGVETSQRSGASMSGSATSGQSSMSDTTTRKAKRKSSGSSAGATGSSGTHSGMSSHRGGSDPESAQVEQLNRQELARIR